MLPFSIVGMGEGSESNTLIFYAIKYCTNAFSLELGARDGKALDIPKDHGFTAILFYIFYFITKWRRIFV